MADRPQHATGRRAPSPRHGPSRITRTAHCTEAPRFVWPDGARIAFTVTLVLDYWEVNPPQDANPDPASSRRWANSFLTG